MKFSITLERLHSSEVKLCLIPLAPDLFVEGSCSVFGALYCARIPGLGLYKLSLEFFCRPRIRPVLRPVG